MSGSSKLSIFIMSISKKTNTNIETFSGFFREIFAIRIRFPTQKEELNMVLQFLWTEYF